MTWHPMSQPPRDCMAFLACDEAGIMAVCYLSTDGTLCYEAGEHIVADDEFQPTHWMELPTPPVEQWG
jgi:hypothetical protein